MNSPNGVKSNVLERVSISCSTCGTRHDLHKITGNQSYVTVGEQTIRHMWHRGVKFVNKVCMMTIEVPKSSLKFPWRISLLDISLMRGYLLCECSHWEWWHSKGVWLVIRRSRVRILCGFFGVDIYYWCLTGLSKMWWFEKLSIIASTWKTPWNLGKIEGIVSWLRVSVCSRYVHKL